MQNWLKNQDNQQLENNLKKKQQVNLQGVNVQNKIKENVQEKQQKICEFFVVRKKRQCKFIAAKGSKYCHAHCSDLQNKIQCPYQKGMFIDKNKFERHLQNCPRIRDKQKQKDSVWYNKDINKMNQQAKQVLTQKIDHLKNLDSLTIKNMVQKVGNMYFKYFKQNQTHYLQSSKLQDLTEKTNDHMQAYLIAQKASQFGLISDKFIYVQFGAGKGILSFAIANFVKQIYEKDSKNILLQRQTRRNKFDRFFKSNPYFQRYKGDVSDFDFSLLPKTMTEYAKNKCNIQNAEIVQKQLTQCEMIGVCKHMCGEALDISVRGLLKANCKGNILASCCHHLCRYETYLNPKFFEKQGLTPQQINIFFKLSSWGTKSISLSVETTQKQQLIKIVADFDDLNLQHRIVIGRMCKRLIDFGRAQYLNGKVYRYCSDQLTPENYVIITN